MNLFRWLARLFGPRTEDDPDEWPDARPVPLADILELKQKIEGHIEKDPRVRYIDDHYITPISPGEDGEPLN